MPGWVGYHHRTESDHFTCRRCGWKGRGQVSVVGVGRATLFFDKPEKALTDARQDASETAKKTIARAFCKKCGQRNPGEAARYWLPYAAACALLLGLIARHIWLMYQIHLLAAASESHGPGINFETVAYALLLLWAAWHGRRKWQNRDGGVVWLET